MALQSQLFRGDPKLEAAAVSDPAHVMLGARGAHVGKIQAALIDLDGATITQDEVYGPATATAVREFKKKRGILNYQGKIDDIVGRKTITALDSEMFKVENSRLKGGGLQLNFDVKVTFVDIVVNFKGGPSARQLDPEEALEQSFLGDSYAPLPGNRPDPLNRKLLRHKSNNNLLLRLAHSTTAIADPGRLTVFTTIIVLMKAMFFETDPENGNTLQPGKLFILGTSSGGRNAIDFLGFLGQFGFKAHFVAAIDAAFNQKDTPDRPKSKDEPVEPVPNFTVAVPPEQLPVFEKRLNFFQRKGNHAERSFNLFNKEKFLYTSDMDGGTKEIHGNVNGFNNKPVEVTGILGKTDEKFHEECDVVGRQTAQKLIANELKGP